jgi:hypothetical protein
MPQKPGETEDKRSARGSFYAILKRIQAHREFFERAGKMQAKCSAVLGPEMDEIFLLMHRARGEIQAAAMMLLRDPEPQNASSANLETWNSLRAAIWEAYGRVAKGGDEVGKKLTDFREEWKRCAAL